MADTTTVSINAKGHSLSLVVVRDTGSFVTPVLNTAADLRIDVDAAGNFPRTLYAWLSKASDPVISTTSNADDTVTYEVPINGELPSETGGNPEFHNVYDSETTSLGANLASGVVSEGAFDSVGVISGTSLTNNSDVTKPGPTGAVNLTQPFQQVTDTSFTVRVFAEAGEGITGITGYVEDSGASVYSVALKRTKEAAPDGWYDSTGGVKAISVWQGEVDITGAADGAATCYFEVDCVNDSTYNSNSAGQQDIPLEIQLSGTEPTNYTAYVDESFELILNGNFILLQDDVIEGGTSGVRAIAESTVNNSGGGNVAVTLVRITDPDTPWTVSETVTGFSASAGSITVVDGVETENASGSPALGDIDNPYDGAGIACKAMTDQRVSDGDSRQAGGCTIKTLSRHCTRFGRTQGDFGWPVPSQNNSYMTIESNSGDRDSCFMHGGGNSVSRNESFERVLFRNLTVKILGTATEDQWWGWSTGDTPWFMTENVKLIGLGPTATMPTTLQNVDNIWASQLEVENWNASYYGNGPNTGNTCVIHWLKLYGKESDGLQINSGGNNFICGYISDIRGSFAGTHGDVVQFLRDCDNNAIIVYADECSYQGIFGNQVDASDRLRNTYLQTFIKLVNDGDIGSNALSINYTPYNLLINHSTIISPTATVGGSAGKTTSFNLIPDNPARADCLWLKNSVVLGSGTWYEGGEDDSPWAASCMINCHTINGDAYGVRCTNGESYDTLFVDPWTNGGESPGNDDTDWASQRTGTLANRLEARDIVGTTYDFQTGTAFVAGGGIGHSIQAAALSSAISSADPVHRLIQRFMRR